MSKERELIKRVADKTAVTRRAVAEVFAALMGEGWLRDPAEPMPGRTITVSEISKAFGTEYVAWARLCLARIGVTVVPDPEPTEAEKATNDLHDWGLTRTTALELGPWLAGQGWVKAPGGDET